MTQQRLTDILKWVATGILIVGTGINSAGIYPLGPLVLIAGGCVWLTVSILWKEPALIATNSIMTAMAIFGLLWKYLTTGF